MQCGDTKGKHRVPLPLADTKNIKVLGEWWALSHRPPFFHNDINYLDGRLGDLCFYRHEKRFLAIVVAGGICDVGFEIFKEASRVACNSYQVSKIRTI